MLGIWVALAISFAVIELVTPQLVSIWFCVAALFSLVATLVGAEIWVQIVVFVGASILLIILTRPLYRRFARPKIVKTNADALLGDSGVVTLDIDNDQATGQVKVNGQIWSALSKDGEKIPEGSKVIIEKITGVKLIVSEILSQENSEKEKDDQKNCE